MKNRRLIRSALLVAVSLSAAASLALPEPASGGKGGGPIDLLIIKGHCESNFGGQPNLDARYQQMLKDRGYRVSTVHEWQALTPEFLKQFNTVVYLTPTAVMGGGYFDLTTWRSGRHILTIRKNLEVLREYVDQGGGLLIVPNMEEFGLRMAESFNAIFEPYGLETACGCVRDAQNHWTPQDDKGQPMKAGFVEIWFSWTDQFADHPIAQGVRRVYYPSLCTRWDDNYTTLPLKPVDPAWTVVARATPQATSDMRRSPIYDEFGDWTPIEGWNAPGLFAARDYGKGRMAVCGVSPWYLYYLTYSTSSSVTEFEFGKVAGVVMSEGDGQTQSDWHILLDNAYRWLAEPAVAAGMGGFNAETGITLPPEDRQWDNMYLSDVWPITGGDPMVNKDNVRPMKILVGARSALSDGAGSVEQWAVAAKAAGVDLVCFTERFEALKHDQWDQYVADCEKFSDDQVGLLPGVDIESTFTDRFLLIGLETAVRPHLLTPDGKFFWTGHMMLGMGDVLPAAARPQRLAQVRGEFGALPPDLYSAISGIPIATYEGPDQNQVDDGFFAFKWHQNNATIPIPLAVHEMTAPDQLAKAAATGLQCYVNSDTPANAAYYFQQGFFTYGGNPQRFYVSGPNGPYVDFYGIDDWQAPLWTITLKAHGESPITEITANDQDGPYRRFTPNATEAEVQWHGTRARQHWFQAEIKDAAGGHAFLSGIRTLPTFNYSRCMDRQNWFGLRFPWGGYTGNMTVNYGRVIVPGVNLMDRYCPKVQWFWGGNLLSIVDYVLDSTWVTTGTYWDPIKKSYEPGGRRFRYDNCPLYHCMPIPEYGGRVRYILYRTNHDKRGNGPAVYAECVVDIELKQDLTPAGDVWPIIAEVGGNAPFLYAQNGQTQAGTVQQTMDLPAGTAIGPYVTLSALRVNPAGQLGFPPPAAPAKAGAEFHGAFGLINPANRDAIAQSMGLLGPPPYSFRMSRGKLASVLARLNFEAQDGGAAGSLKGSPIPDWPHEHPQHFKSGVPFRVTGANPRWTAGLWTSAAQSNFPGTEPGAISPFEFLDGVLLGIFYVDKDTDFYLGNLVTATDPNLNLAFASEWTADSVRIAVNNPTDQPVTAVVQTAPIPDRKALKQEVTVPAGSTVYVGEK